MARAMRSSRLAWALCGFAVVATLLVWTLRLLIAGASHDVPADLEAGAGDIVWPLAILGFAFVGALVASRHPDNPIGWIFCAGAVAFSLSGLGEAYAVYTLFAEPGALFGGGETMAWFSVWVWVLGGVPLLTLFPLLFPNGKLLSTAVAARGRALARGRRIPRRGHAFPPGPLEDLPEVENPYGLGGVAGDVFSGFQALGWLVLIDLPDRVGDLAGPALPPVPRRRAAADQVGRGRRRGAGRVFSDRGRSGRAWRRSASSRWSSRRASRSCATASTTSTSSSTARWSTVR